MPTEWFSKVAMNPPRSEWLVAPLTPVSRYSVLISWKRVLSEKP